MGTNIMTSKLMTPQEIIAAIEEGSSIGIEWLTEAAELAPTTKDLMHHLIVLQFASIEVLGSIGYNKFAAGQLDTPAYLKEVGLEIEKVFKRYKDNKENLMRVTAKPANAPTNEEIH